MPHLEVLVEEPSAEEALRRMLPRILGNGVSFQVHGFAGKPDLRRKLPQRLRAYRDGIDVDTASSDPGRCAEIARSRAERRPALERR